MLSPEKINTIIQLIETTGDLSAACVAAEISRNTLNSYIKQNNELKQALLEAQNYYSENLDFDFRFASLKFLQNVLSGNAKRVTTITKSGLSDSGGGFESVETKEETIVPPKWLVERYLPEKETKPVTVQVNFSHSPDVDIDEDDPEAKQLED